MPLHASTCVLQCSCALRRSTPCLAAAQVPVAAQAALPVPGRAGRGGAGRAGVNADADARRAARRRAQGARGSLLLRRAAPGRG